MARKVPEINAGSMADIAFLLLIFFLVTTTMDVDTGILRRLPPPPKDGEKAAEVKERNIFIVLINKDNQIAIKGELADMSEIKDKLKEFFTNPTNNANLSELKTVQQVLDEEMSKGEKMDKEKIEKCKKIISVFGPSINISQGLVSLQNDRTTTYGKYLEVQNEIVAAINELRDELSKQTWGVVFDKLDEDKQELIKFIYPFSISEAEPRRIGSQSTK